MANVQTRFGWLAVLCNFFTWMLWMGLEKGLGFMLPTFKEQFAAQTWLIGWMIAIVIGVMNSAGIFAAPLSSIFGMRTVVVAGGFMVGGSLIVSSFASSMAQITLLLAFGAGVGISVSSILSRATIAECFDSNYATATGIAQTGTPIGLMVIAPLVQLFLETYGWRGAFLLWGGIGSHLVVCGALLRQPSTNKHNQESYHPVSSYEHEKPRKKTLKETLSSAKSKFGFSVCFQLSFWIATTVYVCVHLSDTFWCIYFVDHALMKGFTANDAVVFSTAAGVGKLLSKIAVGPLIDRKVVKLRPVLAILTTGCALCFITDPWMNSYWLVLVNTVIFVSFIGALGSLVDVYTKDLIGTDFLAAAFSWIEMVKGILTFCGGFFPGLLYDTTGNYDLAFIIMGCFNGLSLVALLLERIRPNR